MKCPIEESIAIEADAPDQISALEKYQFMDEYGHVSINGEVYFYEDITELLDSYNYEVASEDEIIKLYIDKIAELMDE